MKRLVAASLLLAPCSAWAADESSITLVEAPDREITATRCAMCHSLDYIIMNAPLMDNARWQATVSKMIGRFGAPIDDASADRIVAYLSEYYVTRE